jgi:uncharacterized protein
MELPKMPPCYGESVEFSVDGLLLRGKFFRPLTEKPVPAVIRQGELGGPAGFSFGQAPLFAAASLGMLIYDHHRYSGFSDGEPRQHFDPWQQCRALRHAIP